MLLEVGSVGKAHGLKGEVQVRLVTDVTERVAPGSVLETDRGPLTILASRPHQSVWLVLFDGVDDRTQAEALRGVVLRAEALEEPEVDFVHDLIGSRLVTADGTDHGEIEAVQANPAADLLVLADGRLVPMTFVIDVVPGERVVVDVPKGLLDDD